MISIGQNLVSTQDELRKIELVQLYHMVQNPNKDLVEKINQLRAVMALDVQQYRKLKTLLPYVVCAIFNPAYRKTTNFACTQYFIVDIDHVSQQNVGMETIRHTLQNDSRVALLFASPGGDGLKVFFKFKEKCYDAGKYVTFYKIFVHRLAVQYNLLQTVDAKTCDVARACFVSADPKAYWNENPDTVDLDSVVDFDSPRDLHLATIEVSSFDKARDFPVIPKEDLNALTVTDVQIANIKQLLDPTFKPKPKEYFVPEQMETALPLIKERLEEHNLEVVDIKPISYGNKLRVKFELNFAEIDIYFGKAGFKVVKTNKAGTNELLCEAVYQIVYKLLNKTN